MKKLLQLLMLALALVSSVSANVTNTASVLVQTTGGIGSASGYINQSFIAPSGAIYGAAVNFNGTGLNAAGSAVAQITEAAGITGPASTASKILDVSAAIQGFGRLNGVTNLNYSGTNLNGSFTASGFNVTGLANLSLTNLTTGTGNNGGGDTQPPPYVPPPPPPGFIPPLPEYMPPGYTPPG